MKHDKAWQSAELRRRAEELLPARVGDSQELSAADVQQLVHELQTHQIELEIQNEELRRAQEEIEQSRNKYLQLFDFSPTAYFTLDKDQCIIEVNFAGAALLGVEKSRLKRAAFTRFVAPEDQDAFYFHFRKAVKTGAKESCVLELLTNDGRRLHARLENQCMPGAGEIAQCLIAVMDVIEHVRYEEALQKAADHLGVTVAERTSDLPRTNQELTGEIAERKKAEQDLRQNESRLRLLLDKVPCILWTTDSEVRITSAKGAGLGSVGGTPHRTEGLALAECFRTDDPTSPAVVAHRQALQGTPGSFETAAGDRTFYSHVEPLRDGEDMIAGVIGVAMDITERKRSEEELRALSRRLVETQEDERRSIAHDLHEHMTQYLAYLKILMDGAMRSPSQGSLEEMREALQEVISGVHTLSSSLWPPMLDDLGLLPALLGYFERYTANTHVRVQFEHGHLKRTLPREVRTAAYRIVQSALVNVAWHAGVTDVMVHARADKNALYLKIQDEGVGFDPEALPIGASVGLNGMRERALALGGNLTIETSPGAGTCLSVTLPLSAPRRAQGTPRRKVDHLLLP